MATLHMTIGITKRYAHWSKFLSYHTYSNHFNNAFFVSFIEILKQDDNSAIVRLFLPNGILQFNFADYNVAVEYFTKRSYRFRNTPHKTY